MARRLPVQAVGHRRIPASVGRAAGPAPATARTRAAPPAGRAALQLRRHHRRLPGDAQGVRDDRAGGRLRRRRAGRRRNRHRQGAGRPQHPSPQPPRRQARSCRSTAARFPRTCWRANSSATRKARSPAPTTGAIGLLEVRRRRHVLSRRAGRAAAAAASQAAAHVAGAEDSPRRRARGNRRRRAHRRRHGAQPRRDDRAGRSSARICSTASTSCGSICRRCASAGDDIGLLAEYFASTYSREMRPLIRHHARGLPGALAVPLAGQRPRVAKRDSPRDRLSQTAR